MKKKLISYLSGFITENRKARFDEIINYRTRYMTIVLEDIFQPHNASAVLRSCDCFGVQDVHIIENNNQYLLNPDVALGSSQWLTLNKYSKENNNTKSCLVQLKKQGYKIIATMPHENGKMLEDLDINQKFALVFGTEMQGLTSDAIEMADEFVKIPMFGFTESLNISVSAAICMHYLTLKLRKSTIEWTLSEAEKNDIQLEWLRNTISKVELIEKDYLKKMNNIKE